MNGKDYQVEELSARHREAAHPGSRFRVDTQESPVKIDHEREVRPYSDDLTLKLYQKGHEDNPNIAEAGRMYREKTIFDQETRHDPEGEK